METLTMEKITDYTEFDFYYSPTAFKERGGRTIEGKRYVERVIKGREPYLIKFYGDLKLVHSGMNKNLNSESL